MALTSGPACAWKLISHPVAPHLLTLRPPPPSRSSDEQHFSEHGVRWAQSQSVISLAAARSADRVPEEALSRLLGEYTSSVPSDLSAMSGYEELQKLLQEPDLQV